MDRAQGAKNKGNKYFKAGKYENAIQCYTEAIALCPTEQKSDLSTFYQNRAAAYEQQVGTTFLYISHFIKMRTRTDVLQYKKTKVSVFVTYFRESTYRLNEESALLCKNNRLTLTITINV